MKFVDEALMSCSFSALLRRHQRFIYYTARSTWNYASGWFLDVLIVESEFSIATLHIFCRKTGRSLYLSDTNSLENVHQHLAINDSGERNRVVRMLMEDELHYDDDDENGEFEGIVNETDIINPSKDCDYDVDYNDMAARFESFLSRAQLASPASSPSTSEVKTSAESAVDTMEMETPAAPAAVIPAEVRRSNNNNNFCLLPPHVTKGPYADGGGDGDPGQRCPGPGLRHDPAERRPAPPPRPRHPAAAPRTRRGGRLHHPQPRHPADYQY